MMKNVWKKCAGAALALVMTVGILPSVFAATPFTDVKESSWYAQSVEVVRAHDVMNGMTETTFAPDAPMTRAMAAVTLYRLSGSDYTGTAAFTDLDANVKWYQDGIAWAEKTGVTAGVGGGKFNPDAGITREQFLTMLWRQAGMPKAEAAGKRLDDLDTVSSFAKDALNWAISQGILQGDQGKAYPQRITTRAEAAKLLAAFIALSEDATAK